MTTPIHDVPVRRIDGSPATLGDYKGQVLLVVNVASECGLTPQYEGLEKLYESHKAQGLTVVGFPANEFGAQEPGTNDEIQQFCRSKFGIQFPMFEKIVVKGPGIHPLYAALIEAAPKADDLGDGTFAKKLEAYGIRQEKPDDVAWNFEKFLVDREGRVVGRFAPSVTPENPAFVKAVEEALAR
jgi:glutathione peroxidase